MFHPNSELSHEKDKSKPLYEKDVTESLPFPIKISALTYLTRKEGSLSVRTLVSVCYLERSKAEPFPHLNCDFCIRKRKRQVRSMFSPNKPFCIVTIITCPLRRAQLQRGSSHLSVPTLIFALVSRKRQNWTVSYPNRELRTVLSKKIRTTVVHPNWEMWLLIEKGKPELLPIRRENLASSRRNKQDRNVLHPQQRSLYRYPENDRSVPLM